MLGVYEKWLTENTIWRKNIAIVGRKPAFQKAVFFLYFGSHFTQIPL